jgi:alpha-tubulin suppressor-like RCC1 family protein
MKRESTTMRRTIAGFATAGLLAMSLGAAAPALATEPAVFAATGAVTSAASPTSSIDGGGPVGEAVTTSPSARLSSGGWTTCYVVPNGDVRCWGEGAQGQRGDALLTFRTAPVAVLGVHDATEVGVGETFACARRATGAVACWGDDSGGQLGDGGPNDALVAKSVPGVTGAIAIGVGLNHGCALLGSGAVTCWGSNDVGQLGRAAFPSGLPAAPVPGVTGATAITTGYNHTCALLADGTARCWGDNTHGELGHATAGGYSSTPVAVTGLSGATAISGGLWHTCAVIANGGVRCWGENNSGQLGNGATLPAPDSISPQAVAGVSGAVSVSAGYDQTCAVQATGAVSCWGGNVSGQLGGSAGSASSTAVTVPDVTATAATTGYGFSCALKLSGGVTCWGGNNHGALGRYTAKVFPNGPADVIGDLGSGAIAVGGTHTCALTAARSVQCWGDNSLGQLGIGSTTTTKSSTPRTVSGLTGVVALSSGTGHSCAVLSTGSVRCWGDGSSGQLGDNASGTGHKALAPVPVSGLTDAVAITAGGNHTCAIRRGLTAVCWGANADGQLGDNSQALSATPQAVQGLGTIVQISAGSGHTCAIRADTTGWCWGANGAGQLGNPIATRSLEPVPVMNQPTTQLDNVVEIVARYAHSCALFDDGLVSCWGDNTWGELARGSAGGHDAQPLPVINLGTAISLGPATNHGVHECAIQDNATVHCWGANDQGQLGKGTTSATEASPVAVASLTGAVQISVGFQDSCALLANGGAKCWGNNDHWQLGSTTTSPDAAATPVDSFSVGVRALSVDAGTSHTCAVADDGSVRCWGSNGSGRLGDGTTAGRPIQAPVLNLSNARAVSAGGSHTCALFGSGTVVCWGSNTYGQLGNGTSTFNTAPAASPLLVPVATAVASGGNHTCALLSNGTVKCWGLNSSGQLGDGTTTSRKSPVTVKSTSTTTLTGVVAISAGTSHTCALLSNGTVRCWGAGGAGRLGNGSTSNRLYASSVSGVSSATAASSRFTSISAGGSHTCGRIANGTSKCWGYGASGRLGNASTASHSTPVTVSGLTSVVQVSAGGSHTCALLSSGIAKCWGYNAYGQLGIGSTTSKTTPVTVTGLSGATSISAGGNHTAAGLGNGSLRAWGLNSSGQIGDTTGTNRTTPRGVSGF